MYEDFSNLDGDEDQKPSDNVDCIFCVTDSLDNFLAHCDCFCIRKISSSHITRSYNTLITIKSTITSSSFDIFYLIETLHLTPAKLDVLNLLS